MTWLYALTGRTGQHGWVRTRSVRIWEAYLADRREEDFLHRLSPHVFVLQNAECPLPVDGVVGLRRELLRCGSNNTPQVYHATTAGQQVVLAARGRMFGGVLIGLVIFTRTVALTTKNTLRYTGKTGRSRIWHGISVMNIYEVYTAPVLSIYTTHECPKRTARRYRVR